MTLAHRFQLAWRVTTGVVSFLLAGCCSTPDTSSIATPPSIPTPTGRAVSQPPPVLWIAPALRLDQKVYALRNPMQSKCPPTAKPLDDEDLEVFQHIYLTPENPTKGNHVTLVSDDETCVGTVTGLVDIYMACTYEESRGEYVKRQGLRVEGCPSLEKRPAHSEFRYWAVEGSHPKLRSYPLEEVVTSRDEEAEFNDLLKAYASASSLPDAENEALKLHQVKRLPNFSTAFVESTGEEYPRLHLVGNDTVIRHFPERFTAQRYMDFNGRVFVFVSTEAECRNIYTTRGNDLVPYNDDCLYLYCGDGMH